MANITHFNVRDVALYYQGLVALAESPMASAVAAEEIRRRAVTSVERRRAIFSLPSPRGHFDNLGEKILVDLRQMNLATVADTKVKLTAAGLAIADGLKKGEGRRARLAILGRLVETYDNAAFLCATVTPPIGKPLFIPNPRAATEEMDDEEGESRVVPANLESVCAAWAEWCLENHRPDLMPPDFLKRAEALLEASKEKRGFAEKARNALAQLVVESATKGRIAKAPLFGAIRDRLSTAGGLNSVTRPVPGKPLSVEVVFSCMHIGRPSAREAEWQPLGARIMQVEDVWIHEAEPAHLVSSVLAAILEARRALVERAGYYRIYELRDRVCEGLTLSQGMFDSVFVHMYRTRPGLMTLGVDYEKITAKRLPIEIRDGASSNLFNLVAFKGQ
ncbi:MAG TPA: hypothetical protein VMV69_05775 [Pirellulales bacterium]|nr:hypothetical protein [Pirellulales bacterium]